MKNLLKAVIASFLVMGLNPSATQAQSTSQEYITKGPENGKLIIIGGSARSEIFRQKFIEYTGGKDATIIIVPTAQGEENIKRRDPNYERLKAPFIQMGVKNIHVLNTEDSTVANREDFIAPIKKATGVWFTGGRQWRIADGFLNTKAHQEFNKLLERGGVVAGSSAGATIQGSYLARGDTQTNTVMMGDHEEGLGFLTNVAIDQHLFARNRQFDMFEILDYKPELLGIGLDENTGIVVHGDWFEVIGESYVVMYDGTRWSAERDTVYQLPKGSREFYMLKEGQKYDLTNRRVIQN